MTTLSGNLVDLASLSPGSLLEMETQSRLYKIECLGGSEIRISGHPEYCPEPVPARLHGSLDAGGSLEIGLIGSGRRVVFLLNGNRPVTTSRVVKLRLERPPLPPSSSVH